jgi:hypothetical protein
MSASGSSSDISKKLIILLLSLLVITILFTAIIILWVNSSSSVSRLPDNAHTSVDTSVGTLPDDEWDNGLINTTTVSGVTRTSLVKSIALLYSTGDGAAWLKANPDWRLFMAQADYMDGTGLSKVWSLIIKSANGSLVAYVDNAAAFVLSVEDNANNEGLPAAGQFLKDSNYLLNNVTTTKAMKARKAETR